MHNDQYTDFSRIQIDATEFIEAFIAKNYTTAFPNHWHEHYCISIIDAGVFNENEFLAKEGTVFITNPSEIHKNDVVFENGSSFRTIYLSQKLMDTHSGTCSLVIDCRAIKDKELFGLIDKISNAILADKEEFSTDDLTVMARLLALNYQSKTNINTSSEVDTKIQKVKNYINDNLTEKLNIDILASIAGFGKTSFIKYYKKKTGISPFEYIMMKRIQHGMMLINKGESITEAALSSGFYDQSQFIRYFKKYVGVTPSRYKN